MKKISFFLLFATICCFSKLFAQSNDDSLANLLVKKHIAINASKMTMPGYRVQIYYGSQRAKATEIRTEVLKNFPQVPAYLIYQQPNFKLRLGDFKTRMEAMKLLDEIKREYAQAFIVKDEVKLPEAP
ncbi:MAG: SPOR domain-containing protein [Bacteroidota bacterium]